MGSILTSLPVPLWKYIFIPAFLFMPAPLSNAQGYWSCRSLSERSGYTFLVVPFVLSAWHLWADDWSSTRRERGTLVPSQRDERKAAFKQDGSCPDRPEESFKTFASHYKKKKLWKYHYFMTFQICGFSGN